jgi:hypothetical protein
MIVGAITCLALALSLVAVAKSMDCNPSQRFAYATPHVASQWKTVKGDLTTAQQQVLVAVLAVEPKLHGPLGRDMNDRTLYFALPGHVLTLWFGEATSPTGEFPASTGRCGSVATNVCRMSYPVLGSPNIQYFPSKAGGLRGTPPAGLRWYQTMEDSLSPIDRVAKDAYERYHVPSPLSKGIDYFEPTC